MNSSLLIAKLAKILEENKIDIDIFKIDTSPNGIKDCLNVNILIGGKICQMKDSCSENIVGKKSKTL